MSKSLSGGLSTSILPVKKPYFGPELRPHFILEQTKIYGDALIAFRGPCDVKTESLVDWEDKIENDFIKAKEMIHFIGEFFGSTLHEVICFQRLFAGIVKDSLVQTFGYAVRRSGDDLYTSQIQPSGEWIEKKMSVSIVAASSVSCVLHFGLNIDAEGAPVEAFGIKDWCKSDESLHEFISLVLLNAKKEWDSIQVAAVKVMPL